MEKYLLSFGRVPYACMYAVSSLEVLSQHPQAREIEKELKAGRAMATDELLENMQKLPSDEFNYIAACVCGWASEREFKKFYAKGQLPKEINIAQISGDWEFGEQYYTYEWPALEYRKGYLEDLLRLRQDEVNMLTRELEKLTVWAAEVQASTQEAA